MFRRSTSNLPYISKWEDYCEAVMNLQNTIRITKQKILNKKRPNHMAPEGHAMVTAPKTQRENLHCRISRERSAFLGQLNQKSQSPRDSLGIVDSSTTIDAEKILRIKRKRFPKSSKSLLKECQLRNSFKYFRFLEKALDHEWKFMQRGLPSNRAHYYQGKSLNCKRVFSICLNRQWSENDANHLRNNDENSRTIKVHVTVGNDKYADVDNDIYFDADNGVACVNVDGDGDSIDGASNCPYIRLILPTIICMIAIFISSILNV